MARFSADAFATFWQLQQLSTRYQSRQQLQLRDGITLPPYVVHPHDIM
jgi:hypothetical protein